MEQVASQVPEMQKQFGAVHNNSNVSFNSASSAYPTAYSQFPHSVSMHISQTSQMTQQPFNPPRLNPQWAIIPPLQQYPPIWCKTSNSNSKRKRRKFVNNWYQYRSTPKDLSRKKCEKENMGFRIEKRNSSTSPHSFFIKGQQEFYPKINLEESVKLEGICPYGPAIEVDAVEKFFASLDAPVQELCDRVSLIDGNWNSKKRKTTDEGSDTKIGSPSKKRRMGKE